MKINFKIFALLGLFVFISSCTDDLNVTPEDDDVFLAEDFYANPDSYIQALSGIYGNLTLTGSGDAGSSNIFGLDAGTSNYSRCLWFLQEITADEVVWSWENDPGTAQLQRNTWNSSNELLRGMYSRAMFSVTLANEFLRQTTDELLDAREITGEVRNEIPVYRAEARFLRALAYYHLLDLFGKATFVTPEDPIGNYQGPEIAGTELFNFIESEILDFQNGMVEPMQNEYPRADKGAAWMLLAKLYLNAEVYTGTPGAPGTPRYQDCLNATNQVIGAGYSLTPDYSYNFLADSDYNGAENEIIFAMTSDGAVTQNYGATTLMINGEVGSDEGNGIETVGVNGWGGALRIRERLSQKFVDGGSPSEDTRNTIFIGDREMQINDIANRSQGYLITKWKNKTSDGENGVSPDFADTDFPLFRLGDAYLMHAECTERLNPGGNDGVSLNYLNLLRERAGITTVMTSYDLDFLIDERSRELYWEAHRRQDLIRYGLYTGSAYNWSWKGNGGVNGVGIGEHMSVFPIPAESLSANPNLSQNSGY